MYSVILPSQVVNLQKEKYKYVLSYTQIVPGETCQMFLLCLLRIREMNYSSYK